MRTLLVALAVAAVAPAAAQTQDRWQIRTEAGDYIWDVRLLKLEGEGVVVQQADSTFTVPVADINELRLLRKTTMRIGQGEPGGAMAALTGADDEVYDFAPLDFAARLRALQQIFLQHPPEANRPG